MCSENAATDSIGSHLIGNALSLLRAGFAEKKQHLEQTSISVSFVARRLVSHSVYLSDSQSVSQSK